MPVESNLNVTYGLKPQVSSIKMVTVYRRPMFQLWVRTESRLVCSTKLSPVRRRSHLDEWPTTNTTCCNNFFFFILFRRPYLRLQKHPALSDVASSIFLSYLFLISPCPHSRVYLQYRTIVQIHSQSRRYILLNSLDFWSSKTITSILLLSVALLKPCCRHYNPRYDIPH